MKDSDERNDKPENTTNKKENKINTNTEPAEKPKRGRPPKSLTKTAAQKRKLENVADTDAAAIASEPERRGRPRKVINIDENGASSLPTKQI